MSRSVVRSTNKTTLLFSIHSALFAQNARGGGALSPMWSNRHYAPHFIFSPAPASEHQMNGIPSDGTPLKFREKHAPHTGRRTGRT